MRMQFGCHPAPHNRSWRLFLGVWASLLTLILLFGLATGVAQAVMSRNVPCRILKGTMVQIAPVGAARCERSVPEMGGRSSLKPLPPPTQRPATPDPFPVPVWVIKLTVVVIALCVAIGAIGTRLTEPRLITR